MSTDYSEVHEFASFENIEIAGTRGGEESDFNDWLKHIDLHAEIDAVDTHVAKELDGLSGEDFGNLSPKELSKLVKEALADIKLTDDGRYAGSTNSYAPNTTTITPSNKIEVT